MIIERAESAFYRFERGSLEFSVSSNGDKLIVTVDLGQGQSNLVMSGSEAYELADFLKRTMG